MVLMSSHPFFYDAGGEGGGGSDETETTEDVTQQNPDPAVQQNQTTEDDSGNPAWLPDRLRRAERTAVNSLLQDIGVTDAEELKSIIAAARELENANKTEVQRVTEQLNKLKPKAERAGTLEAAFNTMLESELASVPDDLRPDLDVVLDAIPTPEGKYTAMHNWLKTMRRIVEQQEQNTTTGKPKAPNLNSREGATDTSEAVDVPDEYLEMANRLGWSEEEIEKYRPKG